MPIDVNTYQPQGDKKNSEFYHEYLQKIYDWRHESGHDQLLKQMRVIMLQVEKGSAIPYLVELSVMTPYRLTSAHINQTHKIFVLKNTDETPYYFVFEPLEQDYSDKNTELNKLYPISATKPNARYMGEIFQVENLEATQALLESHDIGFFDCGESPNAFYRNQHFAITTPSAYTHNRVGYVQSDCADLSCLNLGETMQLTAQEQKKLDIAKQFFHDQGFDELLAGVDHLATRVLSSDRECAILEFLTLSPYYFWGAFNIKDMNSSTNVTRHMDVSDDRMSPAKVFTANNTPYFVNAFDSEPMPTEQFVLNLGPRMHHIAQQVVDGDHGTGVKNIDYVVQTLKTEGMPFLAKVFGECKEPDLKQIFSKRSEYSMLITEYVQRCFGYDNFFTKANVAALTEAAGADEVVKKHIHEHGQVFD